MDLALVIKKPIITEKSVRLAKKQWYTFAVHIKATKQAIALAAKKYFGVEAITVRTSKALKQKKQYGRLRHSKKPVREKKAFIRVKPGQKIDLFVTEEGK